jgi:putative membrane protein
LALIAAGLGITSLLPEFHVGGGRRLIGIPLIVLGAVLAVASYRRWDMNERAMRLGRPLPPSRLSLLLAIGIAVVAVVAAIVAAFGSAK